MSFGSEFTGPIPGPRSRALAAQLSRVESPNITYLSPDFPIFWESAAGCWVTDVDGNRFLDMTAAFGVAGIGHTHPKVTAAIQSQAATLIHGMGDVHPSAVKVALCERVATLVPIHNAQVILSQNGGDAVESAIKTAKLATGKSGVLAFHGAYHGLSYGALNVTSRGDFREPFLDQLGRFSTHLPFAAPIDTIEQKILEYNLGAVIVEPIQGRGGIVIPPDGWLRDLQEACRRYNALLILDEIFTGWGRTGELFACERERVTPDILCIGKAMGGGLPISACVASETLMACWGKSQGEALHTSTFLGNPLACAAALAAIDVIVTEDLPKNALETGAILLTGVQEIGRRYPHLIKEARGRGLMIGLQFNSQQQALKVVTNCLKRGLIILPAGDGSVLEFVPPLTITPDEVEIGLSILNSAIFEL